MSHRFEKRGDTDTELPVLAQKTRTPYYVCLNCGLWVYEYNKVLIISASTPEYADRDGIVLLENEDENCSDRIIRGIIE